MRPAPDEVLEGMSAASFMAPVALAAALALGACVGSGEPTTELPWLSGACCVANQDFGNWRGARTTIVGFWDDWDEAAQRSIGQMAQLMDWDESAEIAPGFIVHGETMAAAAEGAYESRWVESMRNIDRQWPARLKTLYLRPAHEMNGDWYPWAVNSGNVAAFKAAWIRYYDIVQRELVQKGRNVKVTFGTNFNGDLQKVKGVTSCRVVYGGWT